MKQFTDKNPRKVLFMVYFGFYDRKLRLKALRLRLLVSSRKTLPTETYFTRLQESSEPLEVEKSTGLFDTGSELFKKNLMVLVAMLCSGILAGILWEVLYRIRLKRKVQPHGNSIRF